MKLMNRLLLYFFSVVIILTGVLLAIVDWRLHGRILDERENQLRRAGNLIAAEWTASADPVALARRASRSMVSRVTLTDLHGAIVADASPEVDGSKTGGKFSGNRASGQELRVSVRAPRGVVQIAATPASLEEVFRNTRNDVLTAGLFAMLWVLFLAVLFARHVTGPVVRLRNMAQALAENEFPELPPVETAGEIRDLAESLGRLSDRMKAIEVMRSDLIANVSHELCSPLTIASGFASTLARQDPPPAARRQFANAILSNTNRMQRIIDDMLDLSRIESGGWIPRGEVLSLSEITEEIFDSLRPTADYKGIELRLELDPDATILNADRTAVRQTISNLTENALRHTSEGSVTVFSERTQEGVWIAVKDTGEGIAAHNLPRIFERLYRIDSGRARKTGGTGIGLAIVKHMAEAHGGRVSAQSQPGLGTTIKALFPQPMGPRRRPTPPTGMRLPPDLAIG